VLSGNLRSRLPLVAFGASTSIWPGAGTESDIVNKAELRARFPDPGKTHEFPEMKKANTCADA